MSVPYGIEVRPPAICGDLTRLMRDPPPAVGLIDGCFVTAPSVWHREILMLIEAGIPVAGASSLGALRAAELHPFGMIGVGRVFDAYLAGTIVRDDAVMLVHAPAALAWRALTIALVDAEEALRRATLAPGDRRMLQRIIRTTSYADRTWRYCLERFTAVTKRPAPIDAASLEAQLSIKKADAMLLMEMIQLPLSCPPLGAPFPGMTPHHARLLASVSSAPR